MRIDEPKWVSFNVQKIQTAASDPNLIRLGMRAQQVTPRRAFLTGTTSHKEFNYGGYYDRRLPKSIAQANRFLTRLLLTFSIQSFCMSNDQARDFYPRSGFDPRFDPDPIRKSEYLERPNPDPDSKMLDPSKSDLDPDILIFKSGYPDS